jgi:hypothetical protein
LWEVCREYQQADEKGRSQLLDEAQKRTGHHQKYLIKRLNEGRPPEPRRKRRRRRRAEYGAAVVRAVLEVWDIFEQP